MALAAFGPMPENATKLLWAKKCDVGELVRTHWLQTDTPYQPQQHSSSEIGSGYTFMHAIVRAPPLGTTPSELHQEDFEYRQRGVRDFFEVA